MKLYKTSFTHLVASDNARGFTAYEYHEFASSAGDASKTRTRIKKEISKSDLENLKTEEVEVATTRTELIKFLNGLTAHESWAAPVVAEKLGG